MNLAVEAVTNRVARALTGKAESGTLINGGRRTATRITSITATESAGGAGVDLAALTQRSAVHLLRSTTSAPLGHFAVADTVKVETVAGIGARIRSDVVATAAEGAIGAAVDFAGLAG